MDEVSIPAASTKSSCTVEQNGAAGADEGADRAAFLGRAAAWAERARAVREFRGTRRQQAPERKILKSAIRRCHLPDDPSYPDYGGRGITVCDQWRTADGWVDFCLHVGRRPTPQHTLDRIDNDRGYEPGNVRWATRREQRLNSRTAHFIEANGERLCVDDWAKRLGTTHSTVVGRIRSGWDPVRAVTTPVRKGRYRRASNDNASRPAQRGTR